MRGIPRSSMSCLIGLLALHAPAFAQSEFANIVDHVHLASPDPTKTVAWYQKHFGGQSMSEGPDRLMFGQTRLIVQKNETPQPSAGSVLDHISLSVTDVDAALREIAADGGKMTASAREVPGLVKVAFAEDPWGTRIPRGSRSRKGGPAPYPVAGTRSRGNGT